MSDTRCADPELQLDVDVMILEYTLYHAIRAQFEFLSKGGCHDEEDDDSTRAQATESTRLLTVFDCFVHHFNQRHPGHPKSSEFYSNLDMLEFLVLLSHRSNKTSTEFSDDTRDKLRSVSVKNLASRRRWLVARERYARRLSKQPATSKDNVLQDVEDQIYKCWNRNRSRNDTAGSPPQQHRDRRQQRHSQSQSSSSPSLFDLLPRFIAISAEMSATLNLPPNETWMHVACEFMLQASLESLRSSSSSSDDDHNNNPIPRLDDCFAWGYVDPHHLVPDDTNNDDGEDVSDGEVDKTTQLVNDLFADPDHMSSPVEKDSENTSGQEDPEWTQIRSKWLSEFSMVADSSEQSQSCRLDRLTVKFPLDRFLQNLIVFMQNVWNVFCEGLNGEPILAQIEQGHMKSLGVEGKEYEEFLTSVGLGRKKSSPEIITFDVPETKTGRDSLSSSDGLLSLNPPEGFRVSGNAWSKNRNDGNENKTSVNMKKRTRSMM